MSYLYSFPERSLSDIGERKNRSLATGNLSKDHCPHGPIIDLFFFLRTRVITMYAWGLYPLFHTGNLFQKKVGPKKIIQDKFGYSPPYAPQTGMLKIDSFFQTSFHCPEEVAHSALKCWQHNGYSDWEHVERGRGIEENARGVQCSNYFNSILLKCVQQARAP